MIGQYHGSYCTRIFSHWCLTSAGTVLTCWPDHSQVRDRPSSDVIKYKHSLVKGAVNKAIQGSKRIHPAYARKPSPIKPPNRTAFVLPPAAVQRRLQSSSGLTFTAHTAKPSSQGPVLLSLARPRTSPKWPKNQLKVVMAQPRNGALPAGGAPQRQPPPRGGSKLQDFLTRGRDTAAPATTDAPKRKLKVRATTTRVRFFGFGLLLYRSSLN